jgi:precorrin-2 dehydrogenase / sirohydrochlorin ferrochelatase
MPRIHAMVPLALDPAAVAVAVAGRGAPALARLRALREGGAEQAILYSDRPTAEVVADAGVALRSYLPDAAALEGLRLLWIAGLPDPEAARLAEAARRVRVLVNVEDRPELCDFHNVASIRRGDLLLTVSTGGKSPGLAARIRQKLGAEFGPEWAARIAAIGRDRTQWRRQGRSIPQLATLTNAAIDRAGWLS